MSPGPKAASPAPQSGAEAEVAKSAPLLGKSIAAMQTCLDSLNRIPAITSLPGELSGLQHALQQSIVTAKATITHAKPLRTRLINTKAFVQRKQAKLEQILGEIAERQKQVEILRQVISHNSGILETLQLQLQQQEQQELDASVRDPVMLRLLQDLEGIQAPELGPVLARFKEGMSRCEARNNTRFGDSSDEEMGSELQELPESTYDSEDQKPRAQLLKPHLAVNISTPPLGGAGSSAGPGSFKHVKHAHLKGRGQATRPFASRARLASDDEYAVSCQSEDCQTDQAEQAVALYALTNP